MKQSNIPNLASVAGRLAYQEFWYDLVVEQNNAVLTSLWQLWRTAVRGSEIRITAADKLYRIGHPLGPRLGTRIFMEEIIVRHYFNNVQALVYFGAVLLLIFLGLRFTGVVPENIALIGIGIEALMLLTLFIVLFYAPDEDILAARGVAQQLVAERDGDGDDEGDDDRKVIREVLEELEEIGSSYATLSLRLEQLAKGQEHSLKELNERVGKIQGLNLLESHAERLETTNTLLEQLVSSIEAMSKRIDLLFGKEVEFYVRREFERVVSHGVNDPVNRTPPPDNSNS